MKYNMTIHYVQEDELSSFDFEDDYSIDELKERFVSADMDKPLLIKDCTSSLIMINWREVRNFRIRKIA